MRRPATALLAGSALAGLALAAAGCGGGQAVAVRGGDGGHGRTAIRTYGCGACHAIAGVSGADGEVGPPLRHFGERRTIAGRLPNTPPNLVRWIRQPQEIDPGTLMPDLGVDETDARDIAAYLYGH